MSAEVQSEAEEKRLANVKRKGLRVALAVAVGFTWAVCAGAAMPFLAPFFASQFLIAGSRPLPLRKALGLLIIVIATGALMQIITSMAGHRPIVMTLLLGLFYFTCFFLQAKGKVGGQTIFFVVIVAVLVPLMAILNHNLAATILSTFVYSVIGALLLMWMAHAVFPDTGISEAVPAILTEQPDALRFAACNAVILLVAVVACLTIDGLSTAIVIPMTVTLLLSQADVARSAQASLGLVAANLFGGAVACIAYAVYQVRPNGLSLFLIVLFVGMQFGGRAALDNRSAKLFSGALTIFLTIMGTAVSPLPGSAAESFASRIVFILLAVSYTIFMVALLWPRRSEERERLVAS